MPRNKTPCPHGYLALTYCTECTRQLMRNSQAKRRSTPEGRFNSLMQTLHHREVRKNFTFEQYEQMKKEQNNLCKICRNPETATRLGKVKELAIDHCHRTHKVRGLLCEKCNKRLGHYEAAFDDQKNEHFIKYLKKRPDQNSNT